MTESTTALPAIGDEVEIRISPSVQSDKTWRQFGKVLTMRNDPIGLIVGQIQITGKMTAEANPHHWHSDDNWVGCIVDAVLNPYDHAWRATRPVCDHARDIWAKCGATEMAISDILLEAEVAINEYVNTGYCGANDDPVRKAVMSLLAHMQTVRHLPGLDQQPHEAGHRIGVEKAAPSDSDDEWDQD